MSLPALLTNMDFMGGRNTDPRSLNLAAAPFSVTDNGYGQPFTVLPAFGAQTKYMTVDVVGVINTQENLVQVTGLPAGTYLYAAQAQLNNTSGAAAVNGEFRVWDANAVIYGQGEDILVANEFKTLSLVGVAVITGAQVTAGHNTLQFSFQSSTVTMTVKAAPTYGGSGTVATQMTVFRIA